jgi:hypothetical protein
MLVGCSLHNAAVNHNRGTVAALPRLLSGGLLRETMQA